MSDKPTLKLETDAEYALWPQVYAAEYATQCARWQACFRPSADELRNAQYGSGMSSEFARSHAIRAADRAVLELRERLEE